MAGLGPCQSLSVMFVVLPRRMPFCLGTTVTFHATPRGTCSVLSWCEMNLPPGLTWPSRAKGWEVGFYPAPAGGEEPCFSQSPSPLRCLGAAALPADRPLRRWALESGRGPDLPAGAICLTELELVRPRANSGRAIQWVSSPPPAPSGQDF